MSAQPLLRSTQPMSVDACPSFRSPNCPTSVAACARAQRFARAPMHAPRSGEGHPRANRCLLGNEVCAYGAMRPRSVRPNSVPRCSKARRDAGVAQSRYEDFMMTAREFLPPAGYLHNPALAAKRAPDFALGDPKCA